MNNSLNECDRKNSKCINEQGFHRCKCTAGWQGDGRVCTGKWSGKAESSYFVIFHYTH